MVQVRVQTNPFNQGILDYDPADPNHSLTHKGYAHHSGTEFTEEWIGPFGEWFREFAGDDLVVVELGCGSGILSRYCTAYIGLDGNVEAGNECVGEFYAVDLTVPYGFDPPVQADLIVSFNFLEHIDADLIPRLLRQADQLLRPGGRLFLVADKSTQETGEHVTIMEEDWWDSKFQAVGWVKECATDEFRRSYFDNVPLHWESWGIAGTQQLFLYRKEA